jgi:hypothetical protein
MLQNLLGRYATSMFRNKQMFRRLSLPPSSRSIFFGVILYIEVVKRPLHLLCRGVARLHAQRGRHKNLSYQDELPVVDLNRQAVQRRFLT